MSRISELHAKWLEAPDYQSAYDELGPEFDLARSLIEARVSAGLTQKQLAERMNTTQSAIAHMESGRTHPSTKTLHKIARSTGTRLRITFEPTVSV